MGTPYKMKGSPMQRNFNFTGDSASTTPKYNMKNKGNFNFTGSKASKTPEFSTTKAAKTQNFRNAASKIKTVSSKTNIGKTVVSSKLKDLGTKALKIGGKIAGGLVVATTLYDMYKSGQKHSGGKAVKGQKTGIVTPDPSKSIYKKN